MKVVFIHVFIDDICFGSGGQLQRPDYHLAARKMETSAGMGIGQFVGIFDGITLEYRFSYTTLLSPSPAKSGDSARTENCLNH